MQMVKHLSLLSAAENTQNYPVSSKTVKLNTSGAFKLLRKSTISVSNVFLYSIG